MTELTQTMSYTSADHGELDVIYHADMDGVRIEKIQDENDQWPTLQKWESELIFELACDDARNSGMRFLTAFEHTGHSEGDF